MMGLARRHAGHATGVMTPGSDRRLDSGLEPCLFPLLPTPEDQPRPAGGGIEGQDPLPGYGLFL